MANEQLERLTAELLELRDIAAVFYDLTHKPPGTIEWE
jgi:GMP synthase (glutamine-hydrolysing)